MPRVFLFLVLAAGLCACAGTATDTSAEGGDATTAAAESDKPKMRCYREKNTGFRLGGKRVCEPIAE